MDKEKNIVIFILVSIAIIYLIFPIIAGSLNFRDCRGPKFYNSTHHYTLYRIGYSVFHGGKPREPFRKRTWFYGIEGEPYKSNISIPNNADSPNDVTP